MTDFQLEVIGLIAAFLTTFSFVPQVIKLNKTKDTSSISLSMYLVMITGVCFWLAYGIILQRPAIIIANAVSLVLQLWILAMKLKHR